MNKKPIVAIDISSTGKGGGPYISNTRIINSGLKEKYDFRVINYRTELGRGISVRRIKDLIIQLDEIQPDIVHFSGLQLSGFHIAIACFIYGINKTLVTIHGTTADALYFNKLKKALSVHIFERITLLIAKYNCGVSDYISNRKDIPFRKKCVGTIYNFPPVAINSQPKIRSELGLSHKDIIVVSVARIIKDKGYHIYKDAIMDFAAYYNIKFILVGEGDYLFEMKESLKEQVNSKQVFFLGYREDIQQILQGCDIFVLPTLHETLSIALLEASMAGLALIGSNTGGVPEIIENGYNGFLVKPGSSKEIVNSIKTLINNKELRTKFSENAKVKIQEKFSYKSIEEKIDEVYKNLLKDY